VLRLFAFAITFLSAAFAFAAPPAKVTGIFSNLHYVVEAGDVMGFEIFILYGGNSGYYAVVQCANGWPSKPAVVAATVRRNEVEFSLHSDVDSHCPEGIFKGRVTTQGLNGVFESTEYPGFLKRKRSYWQ
jgi:hypothetical protein